MRSFLVRFVDYLSNNSTSSWILGYARIVTGVTLIYSLYQNSEYYVVWLSNFPYRNTYDGFGWIQALPEEPMGYLVQFSYLVYFLFAAGLFYRPVSILSALITWYFFFLEKGNYNNHYYLHCLFATLFVFVDARSLSLPSLLGIKFPKRVPIWQLLVFQIQIGIVYFFGGIAKLDVDWLQGYPMRFWLYSYASHELEVGSLMHWFFSWEYTSIIYSYGGLLFDLCVPVVLLFMPKYRLWCVPAILFFHLSNHFMFNIGSFPWMMLALTLIFFDADKIQGWLAKRSFLLFDVDIDFQPITGWAKYAAAIFFSLWISFQALFPVRHLLWRGHPAWTGQGNWFAWRMMLTDMVDGVSITISVPKDDVIIYVKLDEYMNYYQFNKAVRCPMVILKFIEHLKDQLRDNNVLDDAIIKLEMYKGLNFRAPRLFNDTSLNYVNVEYNPLISQDWILPYKRGAGEVKFSVEFYDEWEVLVKERAAMMNAVTSVDSDNYLP